MVIEFPRQARSHRAQFDLAGSKGFAQAFQQGAVHGTDNRGGCCALMLDAQLPLRGDCPIRLGQRMSRKRLLFQGIFLAVR